MEFFWLMVFYTFVQACGAYFAFCASGVLAKLLGLLLRVAGVISLGVSFVFYLDWKNEKRKGKLK